MAGKVPKLILKLAGLLVELADTRPVMGTLELKVNP